ncbi:uncharacterized protein LOC112515335 isoform X3 [Cynara cardunculus var. scolymus]|uniref:uncharacterized protein LOC112515335 isoform X3 n=1 Tax=Cynara cardunculus var. scolymus TaxID=59895 RepID=UPI000D626F5F|nr:uncharacterized protein LOC112515335 isoform X3 [Cynara cardunculus var. scolymus]
MIVLSSMAVLPVLRSCNHHHHHHSIPKITHAATNITIARDLKRKVLKHNSLKSNEESSPKSRLRLRFKCRLSNASTYSSRIATDIYLYESPDASFDQYLEDKPRVFKAIVPDKRRSQQLDEVRWELQGLEDVLKPSEFTLGVKGALYPYRQGNLSRLRGQLTMSITFELPPVLSLIPEDVRRDVAQTVLKRLVENMKEKVNGSLLADYTKFKNEQTRKLV